VGADESGRIVKIKCPLCQGTLEVDVETGDVLRAREHNPQRKDFDEALGDVQEARSRRDEDFSRAFDSEKRRAELLEKKFRKAREQAGDDEDDPGSPLDDL
jgi:hypothetical protein